MEILGCFLLGFLLIAQLQAVHGGKNYRMALGLHKVNRESIPLSPTYGIDVLNRSSFPKGFIFGAAGSAYQYEGAWNIDGKGVSNWDDFTHRYPEKIANGSNGDVAADSYHRYKEDIKLLKAMNADTYRFSISWARVIPTGKRSKGVNKKGIEFYNRLIDYIIQNGLTPSVTLFHWDLPLYLQNQYGAFLSPKIIKDYGDYADLCFEKFGDRVKHWVTFNEPWSHSILGYDSGTFAPGRCSAWMNNNCAGGNSGTEPYIVSHHQLLAHAKAVELYKTKYQKKQKGLIGIAIVSQWFVPLSNSKANIHAARRSLEFMFGWFMNPLVYGDYPSTMRALVGNRLPKFTAKQSQKLKGSYDFLGLNYYTAQYAKPVVPNKVNLSYSNDVLVDLTPRNLNGELIGEQVGSDWLHVYPQGLYDLAIYVKKKYKNPIIYITENGVDEVNNATLPLREALKDNFRIRYHYLHLKYLQQAIKYGVRVQGYFGWSLLDNFEWIDGYTYRFGINYVDYTTLKRYRKLSSYWFEKFLKK